MKVRELMSVDLVTARPDTSLKAAARAMAARGVSGLPVMHDGELVGMVTEADFVERTARHDRAGLVDILLNRADRFLDATAVGDVMSRPAITIHPDESHVDAARKMRRKHVKRLPVVDDDGRLLGVISRADILDVFIRPDEMIEHDIRHRIIEQVLAIDPSQLSVEVGEGHVVLSGFVQAKTEAALLEDMIGTVDGVWSVKSRIRYLVDDTRRSDESRPFGLPRPNW